MKVKTILLMLFACVAVIMARKMKVKKCQQKLRAYTKKVERIDKIWEANKCTYIAEWSVCDANGKMTKSYKLGEGASELCTLPQAEEVSCVVTEDPKETKQGCSSVKQLNYTACSSKDGIVSITQTVTCPSKAKSVVLRKPCQKNKDSSSLKLKKDLFHFKLHQLDLLCNRNCVYERQPCIEGMTEVELKLKKGDCSPTITKPCRVKKANKTGRRQNKRMTKKNKKTSRKAKKQAKRKLRKQKLMAKKGQVCKYRQTEWSACDGLTNIKRMVKTLRRGNPDECDSTQVVEKICKRKHKGLSGCKYDKSQWGPCDAASNTVTRTLTLKRGDPAVCKTTKVDVRKCKDKHLRPHVCKYRPTSWGECDPTTNLKVMVKTLKQGDPGLCKPTFIVQVRCKKKATNGNDCKYKFEEWSECVNATNTMTRRQVLESGPSTCEPIKEYAKKCKKPCKFHQGEWSPCDPVSKQMTRVDMLKQGSADYCNKTRVLSKKCGKRKRCVYSYGEWSECDESDNPKRSRIQTLLSGGENCDKTKTIKKPCKKANGEVRCFFGPWTEYEDCKNGVQKKQRPVLQGGVECDRKGVKMKAC